MEPQHYVTIVSYDEDGNDKQKELPLLFTTAGLARLQKETGVRLGDLLRILESRDEIQQMIEQGDQAGLARIVLDVVGVYDVQCLLFAGLEGARLKLRNRFSPYKFDQIADMIDDTGFLPVFSQVMPAFADSLNKILRVTVREEPDEEEESKNPPTTKRAKSTRKRSSRASSSK